MSVEKLKEKKKLLDHVLTTKVKTGAGRYHKMIKANTLKHQIKDLERELIERRR